MAATLWVRCVYQFAQKNSAYITELAREHALQITATKLVDSKTNGFSLQ